ncbi:hypothetical protein ISS05_01745 [Candidatus Woesearchaeota archaeon]|nr:hypothetical protein [Candidatus Woesearchaeota archaeon]
MSKIKIVILGIGIALVLAFVIGFGVDTFYKSPQYEDFCDESKGRQIIDTPEECEAKNGEWNEFESVKTISLRQDELICTKISEDEKEVNLNCRTREGFEGPSGNCDIFSKCNKEFQEAEKPYAKNSFIIIIILGLVAVILGSYLKLISVSSGIMGGGVLVMIYAAMRFWRNLDEYLRFAILVITLAVLIWIGYKKFKK